MVQRADAHRVMAAPEIDSVFSETLNEARNNEVHIMGWVIDNFSSPEIMPAFHLFKNILSLPEL